MQIKIGFVEETVIYEHCLSMIPQVFNALQDYIYAERGKPKSDELYIHLENLCKSWQDNKSFLTNTQPIRRIFKP